MVDEQMREDARVLNVDIDKLIPPEVQRDAPEDFELWPQHERAWWLYRACETQWRLVVGMAGAYWIGLDMPGVEVIRKAHGISDEDWPYVLSQLQVLERETKKLRNQRSGGDGEGG